MKFKKHIYTAICLLVALLSFSSINAQSEDSLRNPKEYVLVQEYVKEADDAFQKQDVEGVFSAYNNALNLATAMKFVQYEGEILFSIGKVYHALGNLDTAIVIFKNSAEKRILAKDNTGLNKTYTLLASIYLVKGMNSEGLEISKLAIKAGEAANYKRGIGIANLQRGNFFLNIASYEAALENYQIASRLFQEIGYDSGVGSCYGNIANIYMYLDKHDRVLEYYNLNYEIQFKANNKLEMANTAMNIGSYYSGYSYHENIVPERRNIDSMFFYYQKAQDIYKEIGNQPGYIKSLTNLGIANKIIGNYDQALKQLDEAEKLAIKIGANSEIGKALQNKGIVSHAKGEYTEALEYFFKARGYIENSDMLEAEMMLYRDLSATYDSTKDYKNALKYFMRYNYLQDTLRSNEANKVVEQLSERYGSELKDQQITNAKLREKDLQDKNDAQERFNLVLKIGLGAIGVFLLLVFHQFLQKRKANKLLTQSNEEILQQKEEIEAQRNKVLEKNEIIEEQQESILDSIHYASRIQQAILPQEEMRTELFGENLFVLFKPRDIVSGDFYWLGTKGNKRIIVTADCTGHGVPGAFMSMLGTAFLNEIITSASDNVTSNFILDELRKYVIKSLRQTGKVGEQKDGMDLTLCIYDAEARTIDYTGANNPLIIIRSADQDSGIDVSKEVKIQNFVSEANSKEFNIIQIAGNKMPIGIYAEQKPFENIVYQLQPGDSVYSFSDGYQDQFGGKKNKKFMIKRLKQLLVDLNAFDMKSQQQLLDKTLVDWIAQAETEQIDDVLVIGFKIQ